MTEALIKDVYGAEGEKYSLDIDNRAEGRSIDKATHTSFVETGHFLFEEPGELPRA